MNNEVRGAALESLGVIGLRSLLILVCPIEGLLVKDKVTGICFADASMFTWGVGFGSKFRFLCRNT